MGGHRYASRPGPKPKKNALEKFTAGAVGFMANEDLEPQASVPSCPNWLSNAAKTEFRRVLTEFKTVPGWVTRADRSVLASYCQHYANWKEAEEHVCTEGAVVQAFNMHGVPIGTRANPWTMIAQKESELTLKAGNMLGLSPGARSTLHVTPKRLGPDLLTPPPSRPPNMLQPPKSTPPRMSVEQVRKGTGAA